MTRARYRAALPPFVITEAGAALAGQTGPDGVIDDQELPERIVTDGLRSYGTAFRELSYPG